VEAGKIEHTQGQLRRLVIDLDHIDGAIRVLDPAVGDDDTAGGEGCLRGQQR
jgi:hypothetical protein